MSRKFLKAIQEQKESTQQTELQILGSVGATINGRRIIEVPNRNSFIYVRMRDNDSEIVQAFNNQVSPSYNLPVILQWQDNRYVVLGVDTARYQNNWPSFSAYLPRHGTQHSFSDPPGGDIAWVYGRQFMPMLAFPSGTDGAAQVALYPSVYRDPSTGEWTYVGTSGTPNLTIARPTDQQARMLLLYWDLNTETSGILTGSLFASNVTGTKEVLPFIPSLKDSRKIPVAGVRLVSGTTTIGWENLYDLRQFAVNTPPGFDGGFAIWEEGVPQGTGTVLNFIGNGITATVSGSVARILVTAEGKGGDSVWTTGSAGAYSITTKDGSNDSVASGALSHGNSTLAGGIYSHAEGVGSVSSGSYSHAEGDGSLALGQYSHAEGLSTTSSGAGSHAEGYNAVSLGASSHAEGGGSTASGTYSHAEGEETIAYGRASHAAGGYSEARGVYSATVAGIFNYAVGDYSSVLAGRGITGSFPDTAYTDYMNVRSLSSGTSITNVGIDSKGFLVSGSGMDMSLANSTFLRLDASNDPLTSQLEIIPTAANDGGLYIETAGDAYSLDVESFTTNINNTSPLIFLYRSTNGNGDIAAPMIEGYQDTSSSSGTITGGLIYLEDTDSGGFIEVDRDGNVSIPTGSFYNIDGAPHTHTQYLVAASNLSDLTNAATARTNLGLVAGGAGDIWVEKAGDTMTGQLVISDGGLDVQGTAIADAIKTTIGLNLDYVEPPNNNTLTLALVNDGGAGNLSVGTYRYYVAYGTDLGWTEISGMYFYTGTAITTDATHRQVTVTVPISSDPRVTKRRIFRTLAGYGYTDAKLLTTINDNTTATYNDNIADATLGAGSTAYFYQANRTNTGVMRESISAINVDYNLTTLGYEAGYSVLSAGSITAVGTRAMKYVADGSNIIAIGTGPLSAPGITKITSVIAIGDYACYNIADGSQNVVAIGHTAGYNGARSYSTAIGNGALYGGSPNSSWFNIAIGYRAAYGITSGNWNIFLGGSAGYRHTSGTNQLYIDMAGYNSPRASNTAEQENGWIYGNFNSGGRLQINMPSTTTNAVREVLRLQTYVSTASTGGANGFGSALNIYAETATNDIYQQQAQVAGVWVDATNATRKAKLQLSAYDTAQRIGMEIEASGSAAKVALFGATPVLRPTTSHAEASFTENAGGTSVNVDSTFGGYTLQQIAQALQDVGILT